MRKSLVPLVVRNFKLTEDNYEKLTEIANAVGVSRTFILNRLIASVNSVEAIHDIKFIREGEENNE